MVGDEHLGQPSVAIARGRDGELQVHRLDLERLAEPARRKALPHGAPPLAMFATSVSTLIRARFTAPETSPLMACSMSSRQAEVISHSTSSKLMLESAGTRCRRTEAMWSQMHSATNLTPEVSGVILRSEHSSSPRQVDGFRDELL